MVLLPRRATAWLLASFTGVACAGSDDAGAGFATLGEGQNPNWMGATEGSTETGPSGADWDDVDESSGDGGTTAGADADSGGDEGPVGSSSGGDDDDDDDMGSTSAPAGSSDDGPTGNPFAGDYAGTADGSCNVIGNVSGDWMITVHPDGTFDGVVDVSGPIGTVGFDGTVSNSGNVVTNDGDCGFLGQIEDDGTSAGDFTCDGGCSGTWSGDQV